MNDLEITFKCGCSMRFFEKSSYRSGRTNTNPSCQDHEGKNKVEFIRIATAYVKDYVLHGALPIINLSGVSIRKVQ